MNRWWYSMLLVFVTAIALVAINVAYTAHVQAQNNQKWCALLASLDKPEPPPPNERARQIQAQIHTLRLSLGCGGTP